MNKAFENYEAISLTVEYLPNGKDKTTTTFPLRTSALNFYKGSKGVNCHFELYSKEEIVRFCISEQLLRRFLAKYSQALLNGPNDDDGDYTYEEVDPNDYTKK